MPTISLPSKVRRKLFTLVVAILVTYLLVKLYSAPLQIDSFDSFMTQEPYFQTDPINPEALSVPSAAENGVTVKEEKLNLKITAL